MTTKFTFIFVLLLLLEPSLLFASNDHIATIKSRIIKLEIGDNVKGKSKGKSKNVAAEYLAKQKADGSWPDIDYKQVKTSGWEPAYALDRIKTMAVAFIDSSHSDYKKPVMKKAVIKGLTHWYKVKPKSRNWFYNDIAVPSRLSKIGLFAEEYLPKNLLDAIISNMPVKPDRSAQNRVWISRCVIFGGLLAKNSKRIEAGVQGIYSTIDYGYKGDGIQPDFSFHQHGPFLHNGGYGLPYTKHLCKWIYILSSTPYAFKKEKVDIISSYILDGTQWMVWGKNMDPNSTGREIARTSLSKKGSSLKNTLLLMSEADSTRSSEFLNMHSFISGKRSSPGITGNKYFNRADYMSQLSKKGLIVTKVTSSRLVGVESINGENLRGAYVAWGSTFIYGNDKTYDDIQPVWNWARIPGITARQKIPITKSFRRGKKGGNTAFCGGTSNGTHGVAVMDLNLDGVTAHKGYFFFGEEMVALGAGISSESKEAVNTTLNQCHKVGDITIKGSKSIEKLGKGTHTISKPRWIYHDDVGYVFPEDVNIKVSNSVQTGSWKDINSKYKSDKLSKEVFSLYFDHGVKPSSKSYSYIVIPGAAKEYTESYSKNNPIEILENKSRVQAVRHSSKKVTQIIFYEAGNLTISSDMRIAADSPCTIIVDEVSKKITVSDPAQDTKTIVISVSSNKGNSKKLIFNLPMKNKGEMGTSVTLSFTR